MTKSKYHREIKPGAPAEAVTIERRANGAVIERNGHVTRHTSR